MSGGEDVMCCNKNLIPLLAATLLMLLPTSLRADDRSNLRFIQECLQGKDLPVHEEKSPLDLSDSTSELEMAGLAAIRLYQVVLSSQDGPRCMFHPSCSEYAKQALARHGAIVGSLMAADRYMRCNGMDRDLYPNDPDSKKLLDPVPGSLSEPP
jgi:putative membrane protein insertion efficiency factor